MITQNPVLIRNYQGAYPLKTIAQLDETLDEEFYVNTHFGDWPAPETITVNTAA